MSIPSTFSQISQAFGFHTNQTLTVKVLMSENEILDAFNLNVFNGIAWIPGFGNILGAFQAHKFIAVNRLEENGVCKPFVVTQIIRGIATSIGLGILLLFIDLIVTLGRMIALRCGVFPPSRKSIPGHIH